ncbi:hypothetical protein [uncultured Lacinutrix sp.]|uniref:hypothetical protein n=1 Tax=uncultured Lacinutrix sp. TaxID=574032 RepID=UPI00260C933A|nr:hypothetical protein [uncultured Lacinutrix sp.]
MKKSKIKLSLNKKTISKLDKEAVKGGIHHTCTPTCTQTALYSMCGNQQCY